MADSTLAKVLADTGIREAVIVELRRVAADNNVHGQRAYDGGNYCSAVANWRAATKRTRAAKAIEAGNPIHPADRKVAEQAYSNVHGRRLAAKQEVM